MTKWESVQLGALASFRNGLNYTSADHGAGLAVVGVSDFQDRLFVQYDSLEQLAPKALNSPDSLIQQGDILFVRSNGNRELIGRSVLVAEIPPMPTSHSGFTIRVRFHDTRADPPFFAYYLRSGVVRRELSSQGGGTNINNLNQGILSRLDVPLPPMETQRRIASILGAYDGLIEVNRRRIKVLEEMARGLFEEWFVRFRFPGHQDAPNRGTPDGPLPEGWDYLSLGSLCDGKAGIQTGPFGSQLHQEDYSDEGIPVTMPKNLLDLRVVEDGITRIPERLAQRLNRHIMQEGDIVYGRRGDIGRRAYISKRQDGWFCGTGCLRLRADRKKAAPRYLFDALGSRSTEGTIKARAQGATMPNLSAGIMQAIPILVPPITIQEHYSLKVDGMMELVESLVESNRVLTRSRDLLLPRLISGLLSVEAAGQMPEAAE